MSTRAYCCEQCDGHASWRLERRGDVATSWACHDHLAGVAMRLQRAHESTAIKLSINTVHPDPSKDSPRYPRSED